MSRPDAIVTVALITTGCLIVARAVQAAPSDYELNVARQPLNGALEDLARQTGLQIGRFSDTIDDTVVVGPVQGSKTPEQALRVLLKRQGLSYRVVNDTTIAIISANEQLRSAKAAPAPQDPGVASVESPAPASGTERRPASDPVPAEDTDRQVELQEVIVTATKRGAQNLQTTPLTVTAFSSADLQNKGISNLADLASRTAGVDIQQYGRGQTQVITRGVTLGAVTTGQPQNRATTGIYVNDVSFEENGMNPDPDLFDLERVEVLKGPQGTLFGSGAMAGAIRYVTKQPDLKMVAGQVVAEGSATRHGGDSYTGKGVINIPLIDERLALRFMAYHNDNGGWIDNSYSGRQDTNTDRETGARLSTLWQASASFSTHLMLQYQRMDVRDGSYAQLGDSDISGPGPVSIRDFTAYNHGGSFTKDKFLLSSLEMNWTLGNTTLTSVSGLVERYLVDSKPGTLWGFLAALYGVVLPNPSFVEPYSIGKFSEELRIATRFGTFTDLTAGVYFAKGHIHYSTLMQADGWDQYLIDHANEPGAFFGADPATLGCLPQNRDAIVCGTQVNQERQVAGYGQVDVHVLPAVTLTAGGRWFTYNQKFDEHYGGYSNSGRSAKQQAFTESGFDPKFGASYRVNENLFVFASAAKGFRLGGVDDPVPSACAADLAKLGLTHYTGVFKSDSLWTYELGAKSTLVNKRVTVDGAVFDTEWSNIQTSTFLGDCGYSITQNASKQKIRGAELATRFAVSADLTVELNANYTDARLVGDALPVRGMDGDSAPFTPRYSVNGTLDYHRALGHDLEGFALLSYHHRADYRTEYNRTADTSFAIPAQSVADLRLGIQTRQYKATLFVNNLTDELVLIDANKGRGGDTNWNTGRPRTVGLELQADF